LDDLAIRRALLPAHYMAGVAREIEGAQRARLGNLRPEGIGPARALELYLESREIKGDRAAELLAYGRRLVEQVDAGPGAPEGEAGAHFAPAAEPA
jgi:hypothetical protein